MGFPSLVPQGPWLMDKSISAEIRGVWGGSDGNRTLGSRATSVHGIHTDPTRPLPPGAWRWGVSTSGSNDHHRGWGHGVGRQNFGGREGAVRRESGARMVAMSTGPAGVRKVGQWVESPRGLGPQVQGPCSPQASSWGSTLALGGLRSPPPSYWPSW